MEDRSADEADAPAGQAEPATSPGMIVFEVATARRVGGQLRYDGGSRLAEIRYAVALLGDTRPLSARFVDEPEGVQLHPQPPEIDGANFHLDGDAPVGLRARREANPGTDVST